MGIEDDHYDISERSPTDSRISPEESDNPYNNIEISKLPEWWRSAIREFDEYGLGPYQPPRFQDGVLKYPLVKSLEEEYNIVITFVGINIGHKDDFTVQIDNEPIDDIGHYRSPAGYTVYELNSSEFIDLVQENIERG